MLSAEDLTFAYADGDPIVAEWTTTFEAGTTTAITGPSGCGKSTLLYLLGLMLQPSAGHVMLRGTPVDALRDAERARLRAHTFGFVFQDAALDATRTVLDNVIETALYRRQSRHEAIQTAYELLERFGVEIREAHRPGQISGGQAQRIALCRAMLADPPVFLADEPTGNLDPATSETVIQALRDRAADGACVVVATHDPAVVEACDRRIRLGAAS
ncbi:ATP-binding cassette domain-containing protein [Actinobacteria bacterium YIM 96077]|uniref:ABC transporter ATP-binding protein n=1 Tax=Phytoactinopolyspora halophila TaxID=1981511 RepID=A0A329QPM7_9ACTN|nr:ATP-binding cassette domain-containing protein [Actinobacteria bacterium YIM 96077]RAW13841.1 ABC transporter ATP-binding protein [Phytoactinopolyspora halophila]